MTKSASFRTPTLDHDKMMKERFGQVMHPHMKLERRIVANLLNHAQKFGFEIKSVWDGEENEKCDTIKGAMEFIFNLDEAIVYVKKKGYKNHTIYLVMGNGVDCICDHSYSEDDADGFRDCMNAFNAEDYE